MRNYRISVGLVDIDGRPVSPRIAESLIEDFSARFNGGTVHRVTGLWQGSQEPALIFDTVQAVDAAMTARVHEFAADAANTARQSSVMVQSWTLDAEPTYVPSSFPLVPTLAKVA